MYTVLFYIEENNEKLNNENNEWVGVLTGTVYNIEAIFIEIILQQVTESAGHFFPKHRHIDSP